MDEANLKQLGANWNKMKTHYDLICARDPNNYDLVDKLHENLKTARKTYKKACNEAKELYVQSAIDRANDKKDAQGQWKAAEQLIAGFTGHHKKTSDFVNMVNKDGDVAKTLQENAATVQQHFSEEVFGRTSDYDPTAIDSLPQLEEKSDLGCPPTIAELDIAIDRMASHKAPGKKKVSQPRPTRPLMQPTEACFCSATIGEIVSSTATNGM